MAALLGLVLVAGLVMPTLGRLAAPDPVYTVPYVVAALSREPRAWVARTALVRGTAMEVLPACPPHTWCPTALATSNTTRHGPVLLLEPGPADPLLLRLRRLPLLGALMPSPQRLRWRTPATYRVLFQSVPGAACHALPCLTAVLVDAA